MSDDLDMPETCRLVRTIYCLERRKFVLERTGKDTNRGLDDRVEPAWDGGPNARGTHKQPIWPKLTQFIVGNKLDPVMFIQVVFAASLGNQPPGPDMFMNERALDLYRNQAAFLVDSIQIYFDNCLTRFRFKWQLKTETGQTSDLSLRMVLRDPDLDVSAIYRYCIAIVIKRPDVGQEYYEEAIREYTLNERAFEAVLGKHLSDGFRQDASRLRSDMLGLKT